MAQRMITLNFRPKEEKALASLVAWACNNYSSKGNLNDDGYDHLRILMDAVGRDELGHINAVMNSER